MNLKQTLGLIGLTIFISMAHAESAHTSRLIDTVVGAKSIKRVEPKYPMSAARNYQEGWVKVSFVIDKQGSVIEPIVEDSSGIRDFERATMRAVKKWKYSPATENGQAIEQCKTTVQMDFRLRGGTGMSETFYDNYKQLTSAITQKDYSTAETLLTALGKNQLWNFTESSWYWLADSTYARAIQDKERELASIKRASSGKEHALRKENYQYILERKFFLELDFAQYANALKTIRFIQKSSASKEVKKQFSEYKQKLNTLIASDETLTRTTKISHRGHINHRLSRNRFQLSEINGSLKEVEIRCDNKRSRFTANDTSVWTIPKKWGKCTVFIKGQENTQFNIVELASQA